MLQIANHTKNRLWSTKKGAQVEYYSVKILARPETLKKRKTTMLNFMRRNSNSWVMIFVFAIIVFVFAVNFGPWAGTNMQGIPHAAVVNNVPISMADFRTAYGSQFARIKQFRPDYDQTAADRDGLKQLVVDQLITRELLSQLGAKNQLKIGARTLAEELKERVFGDSPFNKDEYVRRINAYFQSSVSEFEGQVAKEMVAQNINELLGTAVYVSDEEIKREYLDKNTKISLEFIKINPYHFAASAIDEDMIKLFQEKNADKISAYYNENITKYVKEPEIKASHILVKLPPKASDSEKAESKAKAEKILARLKNNEDFATVAQNESDDAGSKASGGDLGFFTAGMMVEEFSKAAFALKPGEMSGIVESPFGFHIIKQTEAHEKVERKLEDVSKEIAELLIKKDELNQKARIVAKSALDQLKAGTALANVKAEGLVHRASTSGSLTNANVADETESFSRSATVVGKIGRANVISEKAFALTLEKPTADEVIEANDSFYAIRLKTRENPDMAKFEEQKQAIRDSLLYPRKRAFTQQFISNLKAHSKITYNDTLMKLPMADI